MSFPSGQLADLICFVRWLTFLSSHFRSLTRPYGADLLGSRPIDPLSVDLGDSFKDAAIHALSPKVSDVVWSGD